MTEVLLTADELDIQNCIAKVMTAQAGGIDVFIGTVRDATKGRRVVRLEFEAYATMAVSEMEKIVTKAMRQWPLHRVVLHHRTGVLQVGEVPVVIAVSAEHRDAAFTACRYIIDTLKETVPIWKKEIFEDGQVWVSATP